MPASPIQARSSLSEDEKKYSDADVAPVDAPPSEHAREGGVNLKRLIRRVDYRLLPALGLLYVHYPISHLLCYRPSDQSTGCVRRILM